MNAWLTTRYIFSADEWEVTKVWKANGFTYAKRLAGPFETEGAARAALFELTKTMKNDEGCAA